MHIQKTQTRITINVNDDSLARIAAINTTIGGSTTSGAISAALADWRAAIVTGVRIPLPRLQRYCADYLLMVNAVYKPVQRKQIYRTDNDHNNIDALGEHLDCLAYTVPKLHAKSGYNANLIIHLALMRMADVIEDEAE